MQPPLANAIAAVANLQVGAFKLCLIPTGSLADLEVTLSKIVVDLPEYVPDFYVLVEVLEEQESAVISGFISYQQLRENQLAEHLVEHLALLLLLTFGYKEVITAQLTPYLQDLNFG